LFASLQTLGGELAMLIVHPPVPNPVASRLLMIPGFGKLKVWDNIQSETKVPYRAWS